MTDSDVRRKGCVDTGSQDRRGLEWADSDTCDEVERGRGRGRGSRGVHEGGSGSKVVERVQVVESVSRPEMGA